MPEVDPRSTIAAAYLAEFQSVIGQMSSIAEQLFPEILSTIVAYDLKDDGSRVTDVDRAIEGSWRQILQDRYPTHEVVGEEFGVHRADSDYCWYLDPVDGTDDLTRGIPLCGYVIAVAYQKLPVACAIGHPSLGLRATAAYGQGAFMAGKRLDQLSNICTADPAIAIPAGEDIQSVSNALAVIQRLSDEFPNYRVYRNVFAHTLVVNGALEAAVEFDVYEWDVLATQLFIEEVGGRFVSLHERPTDSGVKKISVVFGAESVVDRLTAIAS